MHVDEHQVAQEDRLVKELEMLKDELAPLEERRKFLAEQVTPENPRVENRSLTRWSSNSLFLPNPCVLRLFRIYVDI